MKMKMTSCTGIVLAILTSGCEAVLPEHDPAMAWVDVAGRAGYSLSARRLDGVKTSDARYFQLSPGRHQLELRLGYERKGSASGSQWRHCRVEFDYAGFAAGQRYSVYAVATGFTVRVWLRDQSGERVLESRSVRCGSQY
ncbi:hypothetical protein DFQ45_108135 [Thiopseudomonas denitrificans]|uniref:Lipoprotein n=2 Tax=Thiopseudomonas denitrificans TaxID=1501432 RepID=A0A4R6TZE0_9GAMM|nr:hypothetical protein DFQ45_108135 [Thiopseudomonas denitrificans]